MWHREHWQVKYSAGAGIGLRGREQTCRHGSWGWEELGIGDTYIHHMQNRELEELYSRSAEPGLTSVTELRAGCVGVEWRLT